MLEVLGQYNILDAIGPSGLGDVYRARDTKLGRTVAIKELPAELIADPERRQRFLRDARAAATLSHPNIATLYEIGDEEDSVFLVFEFVPGESLKTVIAGRPLNTRRAVNIAIQIADALAEAHPADIVNRHIRPADVIITPKGNAKILDFGLASWAADNATLESVAYMSPEQILGGTVEAPTDTFSLGIVLFEMLTGRLPFTGTTAAEVGRQIAEAAAPLPSAINRGLPRELDPIVSKALAKDADDRFEALTFAAELRSLAAILDARSEAAKPVTLAPMARRRRRARTAVVWTLTAVLVPAALAGAWLAGARTPITRMWRHTLGAPPRPVLAVIPLSIQPPDPAQTLVADSLTEDLITRLGQTPGLKVVGRSTTREQRGRQGSEIARSIGANAVLTGTAQLQGDTVNVSIALVDPIDGGTIWTNRYAHPLKDTFAVHGRIADDVAQALRVRTQSTAAGVRTAARTTEPEAYRAYARARQAATESRLTDAVRFFDDAIAVDPGLAEAYAGKAAAIHLQIMGSQHQSGLDDQTTQGRLHELAAAADRAYLLDPDLPEADVAMSFTTASLETSLKYLRHAIESDPSSSAGFEEIGNAIEDVDPDRAIVFYRKSLEIDPHRYASRIQLASTLSALDRGDEATNELDKLPGGADAVAATALRTIIDVDRHQFDRAIDRLRRDGGLTTSPLLSDLFVAALRSAGRADDASEAATKATSRLPRPSCESRALLAGLRLERGQTRPARQLADPGLREARQDSASPAAVRCGVLTAAAMNDPSRAAALLARIAAHEDLLRFWAQDVQGSRGTIYLRGRMYPWTNIVQAPAVLAARERLQAAYVLARDVARKQLEGLPQQ